MNLSRNQRFVLFFIISIAAVITLTRGGAQTGEANNAPKSWPQTRASQLVFFAVLEGLYRDGVSNEDIDLILSPGKQGDVRFNEEYFVYACPLCHPAFEAFRLYRKRDRIFGLKAPVDTFGPGLDQAAATTLRNPDAQTRRQEIERLIGRWVSQRLDLMRLSPAEREQITREIERGRKEGMRGLKQASQSRTNCPICDGSFGACKMPSR